MSDGKTRHEVLEAVWSYLKHETTSDVVAVDVEMSSPVDFSVLVVTRGYCEGLSEELKNFLIKKQDVFATVHVV